MCSTIITPHPHPQSEATVELWVKWCGTAHTHTDLIPGRGVPAVATRHK